ncbi:MAG: 30S ribosomal protein S16 [Candidatus Pacebacteria bacterium]|nr:30S ribosomal protein S16 [Candidatus Paceibacterota bacterium]NUQ57326.1 30S ribosomal protein S16 [Candidatus Paceibacter sp.]
MLKIRLQRVGKKHDPNYRVVLMDSKRAAGSGAVREVLGFYDVKKGGVKLDGEKIKNWISKGAQASDTVFNMLVSQKVVVGPKRDVLPPKKKTAEAAAKPAEKAPGAAPVAEAKEPAKEEAPKA